MATVAGFSMAPKLRVYTGRGTSALRTTSSRGRRQNVTRPARTVVSLLAFALLVAALPSTTDASVIEVHLDAVVDQRPEGVNGASGGQVFTLGPGIYTVTPFAGDYIAWKATAGVASGCDASGENCTDGWINQYGIDIGNNGFDFATDVAVFSTGTFETAALALANAASVQFTLDATTDVAAFFLGFDAANNGDNQGGMSLRVAPIPEPTSALLFAFGSLVVGGALKRKAAV